MDSRITYEQAEAIYEAAMEAAQDIPDGNPEASRDEAVAQIKCRVGELFNALLTAELEPCIDDDFGPVNLNDEEPDDLSFLRKPEPCEDALNNLVDDLCDPGSKMWGSETSDLDGKREQYLEPEKVKRAIDGYASQVAEKRVEELLEQDIQEGKPTREQYAKWVAFYISAIDDKEARACGCARDGLEMLRDLYNKEKALAATEPKQKDSKNEQER